jgi:dihydrofolate reductase
MAKLIYTAIMSLDGYVADESGSFDWAMPDEEVHGFVNDLERPNGTYLLGRRMYEVLAVWESPDIAVGEPPVVADYAALWHTADKIVYSTTLEDVYTARTRLERNFDIEAVRELKVSSGRNISIGGPGLAAQALEAGLVDECHLIMAPIAVGGGTPWLPDGLVLKLDLLDERRFGNGMVHLHYRLSSEF